MKEVKQMLTGLLSTGLLAGAVIVLGGQRIIELARENYQLRKEIAEQKKIIDMLKKSD